MKKVISSGLVAIALVIAGVVSTVTPAHAVEVTQAMRCNVAQARLTTRITKVEAVRTVQEKVYTEIQTKLDGYIITAKAAGYDTTGMSAASVDLKTKTTAYSTAADLLSKDLAAAKTLSCGADNAPFIAAVVTTRADLVTIRAATKAVRTSVQTLTVPALKDYAAWLKAKATTTSTTSTTSTTQGSK